MLGLQAAAVFVWVAVCVCTSETAAVDYCGAAMCGNTNAHTFCQYPEGPGPRCAGYLGEPLSGAEKARVLERLNHRRSEAARGRLHLPPASDMLKLRWVEELAREAQIWADQCLPPSHPEEHDACRDLFAITVGQCVASVVGEAPGLRPESMVDMWVLQGRQQGALSLYAMDSARSPVDFAQMLWAHTYLVGCARSRFMREQDGRLRSVTRLVCNFAPRGPGGGGSGGGGGGGSGGGGGGGSGGGGGGALWTPGAPASACPPRARPDAALPGLCTFHYDTAFTYNVTNSTVLKEQLFLDTILEIDRNDSLNYHGSLDQIFLTKMMVASMINQTNEHDSTDHKVTTTTEAMKIFMNITDDENNEKKIDEVISKMISETSIARVTKKALAMIGRPKSYNIEELNVVHKDSENGTTRPVAAVKEDDVYRDYELDDVIEKNEPDYFASVTASNITTEQVTLLQQVTLPVTESNEVENSTEITIVKTSPTYIATTIQTTYSSDNETSKVMHTAVEDETATPLVQNDILKRLLDLSQKTEQNPSDPETARQLEEALEDMERVLATPVSTKVRRELRSRPEEQRNEPPSFRKEVPQKQTEGQNFKEIGTPDAAPILAIINKYAPLIKSYEGIFSRSTASTTSLSLVFILLGCIVSTSL